MDPVSAALPQNLRCNSVKDPVLRDDLAAARAVLKKHSMMLLTASKAYVRHPELSAAKANRDYVLRQAEMDTGLFGVPYFILL